MTRYTCLRMRERPVYDISTGMGGNIKLSHVGHNTDTDTVTTCTCMYCSSPSNFAVYYQARLVALLCTCMPGFDSAS